MIENKRILIIGGTGSLGNALTARYLDNNKIAIYSRSENNQWIMKQKYNNSKLTFYIGDIRDKVRIETCLFEYKPNIIIVAAALKHIDICENNISECINTNIDGIRNIVNIISTYSMIGNISFLETVLFVSTDKACAPVNTYGMCKSVSERIMIEKTQFLRTPKFINVRYGNVLSSRGSLLPLYKNLVKDVNTKFMPVTDVNMTRYFMSLDESVNLINYSILYGNSGDTVIPKHIYSYKIIDIANYFSNKYKIPIKITGIRSGEKIHETLISYTESLRTVEQDSYYIIKPTYFKMVDKHVSFPNKEFNSLTGVIELNEFIIREIEDSQDSQD